MDGWVRAGEPELHVFYPLEPEQKPEQSWSRFKKTGAGAGAPQKKNQEPRPELL